MKYILQKEKWAEFHVPLCGEVRCNVNNSHSTFSFLSCVYEKLGPLCMFLKRMIHFNIVKHEKKSRSDNSWPQRPPQLPRPRRSLTLGMVDAFFLSGPTSGLAVTSLFDPTVVLPSLRTAPSLSHSSFCSLSTLLAWGLFVYDTAAEMDGPAIIKIK